MQKLGKLTRHVPLLAGLSLLGPALAAAAVDVHRTSDTQTAWYWLYNRTAEQITDFINDNNARIIDIEIHSTSPLRITAAFVKNEGTYGSGWWWYYGITFDSIIEFVEANDGRLIDIERYVIDNQERWAVVMVPNAGAQAKAWWYYGGITADAISDYVSRNEARLVDIESYDTSSGRRYAVIMIANTGEDATPWGWFYNVDVATLQNYLQSNNYRLLEFEVRPGSEPRFDAVMVPLAFETPATWWWYYNIPASLINPLWQQAASRITDIDTYVDGGQRYYNIVMLNNANDLTVQMGAILDWGFDGSTGAYLRELDGAELAYLQPDFIFEPASAIKAVHHLHTMRDVMFGGANLSDLVTYSEDYVGSCPQDGPPFTTQTLQETLRRMMVNSDNAATKGISDMYGFEAITLTAQAIAGMTNTAVEHTLGCGDEAVVNPNQLTLRDIASLYDQVENAQILDAEHRDICFSLMQNQDTDNPWWFTSDVEDLIYEVANDLGVPEKAPEVWDQTRLAWKPGGYTLNGRDYVAVGGIVALPDCSNWPMIDERKYVFGVFVHDAATDVDAFDRLREAATELFRARVALALESCTTPVDDAVTVARAVTLQPPAPNPFNPSTQLAFELPQAQPVRLAIYDLRGREIAVVAEANYAAGRHAVTWTGIDAQGRAVPSGIYVARLVAGDAVITRKLSLLK